MSTVWAKQYGRLGNNLFQRAAAIGYAAKHGIEYSLRNAINPYPNGMYNPSRLYIPEDGHQYQELPAPTTQTKEIILNGYWQSEKYFAHCREEVLKAFGYSWVPVFPDTCAIHVRRGDYLLYPDKHPSVTTEYLNQAIGEIIRVTDARRFMFFSDDIAWCKKFVSFDLHPSIVFGWKFDFSEGKSEREDMELMSSCQHQIISNSTFSWWGAWLNQYPNKVVVSPSKDNWFGPGNAHLNTDDIIPDSWIQIKY